MTVIRWSRKKECRIWPERRLGLIVGSGSVQAGSANASNRRLASSSSAGVIVR